MHFTAYLFPIYCSQTELKSAQIFNTFSDWNLLQQLDFALLSEDMFDLATGYSSRIYIWSQNPLEQLPSFLFRSKKSSKKEGFYCKTLAQKISFQVDMWLAAQITRCFVLVLWPYPNFSSLFFLAKTKMRAARWSASTNCAWKYKKPNQGGNLSGLDNRRCREECWELSSY